MTRMYNPYLKNYVDLCPVCEKTVGLTGYFVAGSGENELTCGHWVQINGEAKVD